jgi:hypothetical protein
MNLMWSTNVLAAEQSSAPSASSAVYLDQCWEATAEDAEDKHYLGEVKFDVK